jgi:hypothetical protein
MEPYVMLTSRDLCATVLAKVPRKIRDMIYDYTIEEQADVYVIKNRRRTGSGNFHLLARDAAGRMRKDWNGAKQYSETYTGATLSEELKERWYEKTTFHFDNHYSLVREVLRTDIWALNIEPHELISHVTLLVNAKTVGATFFTCRPLIGRAQNTLRNKARVDVRIHSSSRGWSYRNLDGQTRQHSNTDEIFKYIYPVIGQWDMQG